MKKFTFRLFIIRKLIESLMASCIDEYYEYDGVTDGLAKAHSAMKKMMKPVEVDPEQVEVIKLIAKHGNCIKACDEWLKSHKGIFCEACKMEVPRGARPDYWRCNEEQKSASRWLKEHGIKG